MRYFIVYFYNAEYMWTAIPPHSHFLFSGEHFPALSALKEIGNQICTGAAISDSIDFHIEITGIVEITESDFKNFNL